MPTMAIISTRRACRRAARHRIPSWSDCARCTTGSRRSPFQTISWRSLIDFAEEHEVMTGTLDLHTTILQILPHLRAFAISLCGNVDQADDLVQETILRGLKHLDSFVLGTNMQAWLFTILRNQFHTSFRRRKREVEDPDGIFAGMLSTLPEQEGHLDLRDLQMALAKLSVEHREVVLLIGAEGLSYEETAQIVGTNVGTVKSRMNRARTRLAELLHVVDEDDLGTDHIIKATIVVEADVQRSMQRAT
jgi:RNA polymerase sigma-70 factor (ECF subfamily)